MRPADRAQLELGEQGAEDTRGQLVSTWAHQPYDP
jgi:hypothetical protein